MIVKEPYKSLPDGKERVRYFSDTDLKIRKVGTDEVYDEAIELVDTIVEYEEVDIPTEETEATEEDYQEALREM
jgi:hypothetical protein